ncbi:DUF2783 domain-containing protein [Elioraea tepida]|jgi:hypothetical protein|uniref:DUF2783 domain-containing protein n=1 Tax=Elioraea tepida TaxID=2843330 RepID=A0A975U3Q2_9PROT|nr:DUF2783 domain-containing protein [Elioraea tepida]QXM25024.1 DUF2783 domain-containing protein [Elioraea tepida]
MRKLDTAPRLSDPDAVFAALAEAHRGLSPEESRRLDAALVLVLANHIGDAEVLHGAIAVARAAIHAPAAWGDTAGTVP